MNHISRREALRLGLAGAAVPTALGLTAGAPGAFASTMDGSAALVPASGTLVGSVAQRSAPMPPGWVVKPFDNNQVTLSPSLFTTNRDLMHQFLLNYPIDNMLFLFRQNAGLPNPAGARAPGGWEVDGGNLRGHYAGHFLSAMALGYAGTGNTAFLDRVNYFVTTLGQCQDALDATVGQGGTAPVSWVAGKFGNAVALNGSSNYVTLPAGIVSTLHDFTIATWVRPSTTSQWARVFDFGTGTSRNMFLTLNAGSSRPRFAITTGGSGGEQRISSSNPCRATRPSSSSGSSPSGGVSTRAATEPAAAISEARCAARAPAASPSKRKITDSAPALRTSWRWVSVSAVPQVATTLAIPPWCRPMTSK